MEIDEEKKAERVEIEEEEKNAKEILDKFIVRRPKPREIPISYGVSPELIEEEIKEEERKRKEEEREIKEKRKKDYEKAKNEFIAKFKHKPMIPEPFESKPSISSTFPSRSPVMGPVSGGISGLTSSVPSISATMIAPLPSIPPTIPLLSSIPFPSKLIKTGIDEENIIKEHVLNLDDYTKYFLKKYFGYEQEKYGMMLGMDQINRLNDQEFMKQVEKEVNEDILNINHSRPIGDELALVEFQPGGMSNPINQNNLAYIMKLYQEKKKIPEKIKEKPQDIQDLNPIIFQNIMTFDPESSPLLKKTDIKALAAKEHYQELAPNKVLQHFINTLNLNKPPNYDDNVNIAKEIMDDVERDQTEYENGFIDEKTFDERMERNNQKIHDQFGKDKYFNKTVQNLQTKTLNDANMLNDYLRKIDVYIKTSPSSSAANHIKKLVEDTIEKLKNGEIDMHQAYSHLHSISKIKEAVIEQIPYEAVSEVKEVEVPEIDLKVYKDYYRKIKKEHLVGMEGINLTKEKSKIGKVNVYDLDEKTLESYSDALEKLMSGYDLNYKSKKTMPDSILVSTLERFVDDLNKEGIELDPEVAPMIKNLEQGKPTDVLRKDAESFKKYIKNFMADLKDQTKYLKDLEDKMNNEIKVESVKIASDYQRRINNVSSTEAKEKLENERDAELNKLENEIKKKHSKAREKNVKASITRISKIRAQPGIPVMKRILKSSFEFKPQKASVLPPPKIIPPDESRRKALEAKEQAIKSIYSNKVRRHENEGKVIYADGSIEFRVQDLNDLSSMRKMVYGMKGKLFYVDLRSGRLFEIDVDKTFVGAVYVFMLEENKNESIGGSFAYYPTLSNILREQEQLFPNIWMQDGNDKAPQLFHKLVKHYPEIDYRDQLRNKIGGSVWKSIKNYVKNKTVNAANTLAKNTVYEAKHFIQEEKKNIHNIAQANKQFYKNPSLKNFGNAYYQTTSGVAKFVAQPTISTARELANVSDFAGEVPGLNAVKMGLMYAVPPLAVADAAAHAIKNVDDGKYLDAAINTVDGIIGTGKLSGAANIGTRVLDAGLNIADKFVDKHD